jgi:hypothetical protein
VSPTRSGSAIASAARSREARAARSNRAGRRRAPGDTWGFSLTARRLGKTSAADLAIGIPGEALGSKDGAGAVAVLYGSTTAGLSATGSQFWSQDSSGIGDSASSNDSFGQTLP